MNKNEKSVAMKVENKRKVKSEDWRVSMYGRLVRVEELQRKKGYGGRGGRPGH